MYRCILSQESFNKVEAYLQRLRNGTECGKLLGDLLIEIDLSSLDAESFLELLVNTKRPQIFAESQEVGKGLDWNLDELSILGDLGISVPVTIFDNGLHRMPTVHTQPVKGHLLFIPGALLNSCGNEPADWSEVTVNDEIVFEKYVSLYRRRLIPLLKYANKVSFNNKRKAFITIPGLGCGQFAGPFRGILGEYLRKSLKSILESSISEFPHIRAVYFDPYSECENSREEIGNVSFLVRPLTRGNQEKPQLSELKNFNEMNDDFSNCEFFSVVAWDHVSWPGNDFFSNSRVTDDGVKAASTNSMSIMTGISGEYNPNRFKYLPPEEYNTWRDVVYKNNLQIKVKQNLLLY